MHPFLASEIGRSAPPALLKESGEVLPSVRDVLVPNVANVRSSVAKFLHG